MKKSHDLRLEIKGSMSFLCRRASTFVKGNEWSLEILY